MSRRIGKITLLLAGIGLGALVGWALLPLDPTVEVRFVDQKNNLPLDVEVIPRQVRARPGEMVRVTYRIRNQAEGPLAVYGAVRLEPPEAGRQVEFYLIECGGLQTFESGKTRDYQVMFQVRPESTWVTREFTIQHAFTLAASGGP